MVSEWIEVGVVLDPLPNLRTGTRQRTFKQIEGRIYIAQCRVAACQIILGKRIVRVDRQCSGYPFPGTIPFAEFKQCRNAQMGWPRIFSVKSKFTLGEFDPFPCRIFAIFITSKGPVDLN